MGISFKITRWGILNHRIALSGLNAARTGLRANFHEIEILGNWSWLLTPEGDPDAPAIRPDNVYHTDADAIAALPRGVQKSFKWEGGREWHQVGAGILRSSGRRPDCSVPHPRNLLRAAPPVISVLNPIIFGSPDVTQGV